MKFRWWLVISAGLFVSGLVLGLAVPAGGSGFLNDQAGSLEKLAEIVSPLPQHSLFIFIFIKNVSVIIISLVLSPFFCLVPIFTLVVNGGVLGLVSSIFTDQVSLPFVLAGLLPHGIFELPALVLGEACALSIGAAVITGMTNREKRGIIKTAIRSNLKYLGITAGLLLAAAVIETWLTPRLLEMVG